MGRLTRMSPFIVSLILLLAAACSVPTDDNPQIFAQEELPENLQQRTTTTSTTLPADPDEVREVTYYLLAAPDDQAQRKINPLARTIPSTNILDPLLRPMFAPDFASGDDAEGLINVVTQFEFLTVTRNDTPVATVQLTADEENPPGNQVLRDAAAQLVWTLTQFEEVDAVQIIINGEPVALPADEGLTADPVDRDDFRPYDPDFTPDPVTTTTAGTTAPPTSLTTTTTAG